MPIPPSPPIAGDWDAQACPHPRATEVTSTCPAGGAHRQPGGRVRPRTSYGAKPAEAVPPARAREPAPRLSPAHAIPSCLGGGDPPGRLVPSPRTSHRGGRLDPRRVAPAANGDLTRGSPPSAAP